MIGLAPRLRGFVTRDAARGDLVYGEAVLLRIRNRQGEMFNKKRKYIPVMYYKHSGPMGEIVSSDDFPLEYMDKICLISRRLKDMGVIENRKFIFYSVPKMIEILEKAGVLNRIPLPGAIDTAGVVFGRKYAGWWHGASEGKNYLIPVQMVFYHEKKAEEYFLSEIILEEDSAKQKEGADNGFRWKRVLDLAVTKARYTNTDNPEVIVKNTKPVGFNVNLMAEIKTVYYLTFAYLKYTLLLKKTTLGYKHFISWLEESLEDPEHTVFELTQYFGMNAESDAARQDLYFERLVVDSLVNYADALRFFHSSPEYIFEWINGSAGRFGISGLNHSLQEDAGGIDFNRFEAIEQFRREIERRGLKIWAISESESVSSMVLVIMKGDSEYKDGVVTDVHGAAVPVPKCLKAEVFSEAFVKKHEYLLGDEKRNRELAEKLYPLIGVEDLEEAQRSIDGSCVLDEYLYKRGYIIFLDHAEEAVNYALSILLEAQGMNDLAREIEETDPPLDIRRYEQGGDSGTDMEELTLPDRMASYVPLLKEHGKLLFHLDIHDDYCHFLLADDKPETVLKLQEMLEELEEIADYKMLQAIPE